MCDTFVALPSVTCDGSIIFGKNSDREPNEAQILEYHPAREYSEGEKLQCTYLPIPQVRETKAVLLSRPFWMWGAETGSNEKGVVIGNEAVWTKMPLNKSGGLTGMDLIRLALERSTTAMNALEAIVQLLADYGQGGICGYEDKRMVYHNSFIITDPEEAWVLETAGHLWAAIKVKDFYSISNGLTIGEEFDESHPDLIDTARKNGWLKKGQTFHFANCYSDWFYTTFSASRKRQNRSHCLLSENEKKIDVQTAIRILRDHTNSDYRPDTHFLGNRICAHAANKLTRNAMQTTSSFVAHLKTNNQTYWATGTAAPCTGIFKPIWFEGDVLPDIGPPPDRTFHPNSLWWHHEQLHRSVILDFQSRNATYKQERDELEDSFIQKVYDAEHGRRCELTQKAFRLTRAKTESWIKQIQNMPVRHRPKMSYRRFWKKQNKKVGSMFEKAKN